ncbi:Uncharacterized conserved protein [Microbulbifer donghaiensis]|uniref:Uncharacterized conserved protein n=1 Tax=Microbulbifer donghaiensis TaxID=494016 RepID=A0A1M4ZK39_9GAMM|nr:DUF411 domain-containing protein [Microbulbifer donghaiensis]SHF18182.1 Uncharacterized conserved protein [Microbulbifer donghaiensis]
MTIKSMTSALVACALLALTACADAESGNAQNSAAQTADSATIELTTFKSATCGCCKKWVNHARDNGFNVTARDVDDLNGVKNRHQIEPRHQSCHTSVSSEGYVFEGHVPAKLIRQFLQNPPAGARGLAVPAMPLGSPGMEVDGRFTPYNVMLLNSDGSESVYARLDSIEQQH